MHSSAADVLFRARTNAGLSQRALASLAQTAQSVVARVELGAVSPSWDTLARLVEAAGYRLEARITNESALAVPAESEIPRVLALEPEARLQEMRNAERFFAAIRRAS